MIRAWRQSDGRYRLDFGRWSPAILLTYPSHGADMTHCGGEWDTEHCQWAVPAGVLSREPWVEKVQKVYGVITGPSSCGCEPARFRWVTAIQIERAETDAQWCRDCSHRETDSHGVRIAVYSSADIIEVLGEADVAEAVYEAEFKGKLEAIT